MKKIVSPLMLAMSLATVGSAMVQTAPAAPAEPESTLAFNVGAAAFTQSDTLTQYKAAEIGVRSHVVLPDEVRGWFNMPPLPNGMGQVFPTGVAPGAGDVNSNPDGMAAGGNP